jgi:hypothetical protein
VFCKWPQQRDAASPTFLNKVLLTDEVRFTQNKILKTHHQYTWTDENPQSFQETQLQLFQEINWQSPPWFLQATISGIKAIYSFNLKNYSNHWKLLHLQYGRQCGYCMKELLSILLVTHIFSLYHTVITQPTHKVADRMKETSCVASIITQPHSC